MFFLDLCIDLTVSGGTPGVFSVISKRIILESILLLGRLVGNGL